MKYVKCPNCGNKISIDPEEVIFICDYCGYVFTTEGRKFKEIYLSPINYSSSSALDMLLLWIEKQSGIPQNFYSNAKIIDAKIVIIPYWYVLTYNKAIYKGLSKDADYYGYEEFSYGLGETGRRYRYIKRKYREYKGSIERVISFTTVAANIDNIKQLLGRDNDNLILNKLLEMEIPSEEKKYFSKSYLNKYNYIKLPTTKNKEEIIKNAKKYAQKKVERSASRNCVEIKKFNIETSIEDAFLLYLPLWIIKYRLLDDKGGELKEEYIGIVEATTGRVIYAKIPVSIKYRTMNFLSGAIHIGSGVLSILFIPYLPLNFIIGVGLISSSIPYFIRGFRRKEVAEK